MSKNSINLPKAALFYDKKSDVVRITARASREFPEGFNMALVRGTALEQQARNAFKNNGVEVDSTVPEIYENPTVDKDFPFRIPLAMSNNGEIFWNVDKTPSLLVTGSTGTGKSVLTISVILNWMKLSQDHDVVFFSRFDGDEFPFNYLPPAVPNHFVIAKTADEFMNRLLGRTERPTMFVTDYFPREIQQYNGFSDGIVEILEKFYQSQKTKGFKNCLVMNSQVYPDADLWMTKILNSAIMVTTSTMRQQNPGKVSMLKDLPRYKGYCVVFDKEDSYLAVFPKVRTILNKADDRITPLAVELLKHLGYLKNPYPSKKTNTEEPNFFEQWSKNLKLLRDTNYDHATFDEDNPHLVPIGLGVKNEYYWDSDKERILITTGRVGTGRSHHNLRIILNWMAAGTDHDVVITNDTKQDYKVFFEDMPDGVSQKVTFVDSFYEAAMTTYDRPTLIVWADDLATEWVDKNNKFNDLKLSEFLHSFNKLARQQNARVLVTNDQWYDSFSKFIQNGTALRFTTHLEKQNRIGIDNEEWVDCITNRLPIGYGAAINSDSMELIKFDQISLNLWDAVKNTPKLARTYLFLNELGYYKYL